MQFFWDILLWDDIAGIFCIEICLRNRTLIFFDGRDESFKYVAGSSTFSLRTYYPGKTGPHSELRSEAGLGWHQYWRGWPVGNGQFCRFLFLFAPFFFSDFISPSRPQYISTLEPSTMNYSHLSIANLTPVSTSSFVAFAGKYNGSSLKYLRRSDKNSVEIAFVLAMLWPWRPCHGHRVVLAADTT